MNNAERLGGKEFDGAKSSILCSTTQATRSLIPNKVCYLRDTTNRYLCVWRGGVPPPATNATKSVTLGHWQNKKREVKKVVFGEKYEHRDINIPLIQFLALAVPHGSHNGMLVWFSQERKCSSHCRHFSFIPPHPPNTPLMITALSFAMICPFQNVCKETSNASQQLLQHRT